MLTTHSTLMRAQKPPLKQPCYSVAGGKQIIAYIGIGPYDSMNVSKKLQSTVSPPSIGANYTLWFYSLLNGVLQTFRRCIWNLLKSDTSDPSSIDLRANHNLGLSPRSSSPFSRFFASNVGLIDFNYARKAVSTRSHHSAAELVQPSPSRPITTQSQNPLKPQCTRPRLLTSNPPNGSKPHHQRLACVLKNCPSKDGRLVTTSRTHDQIPVRGPSFANSAARTNKSFGPSQLCNIITTSLFCVKPCFHFKLSLGVQLHRLKTIRLAPTGVKCIPL